MLHERKTQAMHDDFFLHQRIALPLPVLAVSSNGIIATDNEKAITNALIDNVPGGTRNRALPVPQPHTT